MKFSIVSIFPQMFKSYLEEGLLGQAVRKNLIVVETVTPREFTTDVHKTVDDRPFGGGDGMVMLAETLAQSIEKVKAAHPNTHVIYLSAQGAAWSAEKAKDLAEKEHVTLVCGRYGGVDQRFINSFIDEEISVGDYILTGGELAALVLVDSAARFIPGVLGNKLSSEQDSFSRDGLEAPLYTRPEVWREQKVPEILMGGHHQKIEEWRANIGDLLTWFRRNELARHWSPEKVKNLEMFWRSLNVEERKICGLPEKGDFR